MKYIFVCAYIPIFQIDVPIGTSGISAEIVVQECYYYR
jgi:hypothetical protein